MITHTLKMLFDGLAKFRLDREDGPIRKEIPLSRYFEAGEWVETHRKAVYLLVQCCEELNIQPSQLTRTHTLKWYQKQEVNSINNNGV